jgi:hypothetical protein
VVFRPKLAVEATVRQPGALHDVRDSDPIKATLTEERARHVENLFAIRRRLLARHPQSLDITDITSREACALQVGPALDQLGRFALRQRDA